jgi:tetratricopeptide (TPR) repeat protein
MSDAGFALFQRQSWDSAAVLFEGALARDRDFAPALINLGRIWHERGEDARAESLYSIALASRATEGATRALALGAMADLDMAAGAWPAAAANLERAFALDSSGARAYNDLGFALVRAGRALDARTVLARGVTRFPDVAPLHKNLALAALALGEAAAARDAAANALELAPGLPGALAARARAHARLGERAAAAADLEAYLAAGGLDPLERDETVRELAARGVTAAPR